MNLNSATMSSALQWAWEYGYRGTVQLVTDRDGNPAWAIELNHNVTGQQCIATLGDQLVLTDGVITKSEST